MRATTQLTSKPLKAASALCSAVMVTSALMLVFAPTPTAFSFLVFSAIGKVAVRGLVWWNHE